MVQDIFSAGYLALLGLLASYGLYRYYLLWLYYRVKTRRSHPPRRMTSWPTVTIQIPVYNERYVVERAIRSACEVDYPRACLEIQVLDDSTDDTSEVIARTVEPYRRRGLRVTHLTRSHRHGFKAGALAEGLRQAAGELLVIFDVDFVIPRAFLTRTVPFFADAGVGMVQVRWGHVNPEYSLLTKAQAMFLDGHFTIEQVARHQSGRFFSFNGTAGIWRKTAIASAGGWQADTLTEDLDLSYRAQLAGWRCVFLPDLVAPAELPVEMNALKTQQYRWTRGSIQTAKKLLPRLLASQLPLATKAHACAHLASFFIYPIGLLASVGMPLVLLDVLRLPQSWASDLLWLVLLAIPGVCFYLCSQRELYPDWPRRVLTIPWAIAVGVGLSVIHTRAVLDGLVGRNHVFLRTPKFCIETPSDAWAQKAYRAQRAMSSWVELALAVYFAIGGVIALERQLILAVPCAVLFCVGFAYVGGLSLWQQMEWPTGLLQWGHPRPRPLRELQA